MNWKRLLQGLRNDEDGAELVEFSLCLSVLLITTFALLDGARMVYFDHYVGNPARLTSQKATR